MNSKVVTVKVADLIPNAQRNIDKYPINQKRVDLLKASIERTGFWCGYMWARPAGNKFEIAFGHHRVEAAKQLKIKTLDIMVADLDDNTMLQMMANENSEYSTRFYFGVMEPIEQVIRAYAGDTITLGDLPAKTNKSAIRYARVDEQTHPYTITSVALYLGWTHKNEASDRVKTAIAALDLIGRGTLTRGQFFNLTTSQAKALVDVTRKAERARRENIDAEISIKRESLERASKQGDTRTSKLMEAAIEKLERDQESSAAKAAKAVASGLSRAFETRERDTVNAVVQDVAGEFAVKESERVTPTIKSASVTAADLGRWTDKIGAQYLEDAAWERTLSQAKDTKAWADYADAMENAGRRQVNRAHEIRAAMKGVR